MKKKEKKKNHKALHLSCIAERCDILIVSGKSKGASFILIISIT